MINYNNIKFLFILFFSYFGYIKLNFINQSLFVLLLIKI